MAEFRLALHPASEGDALTLSWGEAGAEHHALVDLGRKGDYKALKPYLGRVSTFDLFVITHIDADHIEGAVPLFTEGTLPFAAKQVWFNAFAQLQAANDRLTPASRVALGAAQAEKVTAGIVKSKWPWNRDFKSGIVSIDSPEAASPIPVAGGLTLTLLSPSDQKLANLIPVWNRELKKAGLRTTDPDDVAAALASGRVTLGSLNVAALAKEPFREDDTKPNGTSITLLAEFDGKRVLMGADSHPGIVTQSLKKLGATQEKRFKLNCLKVSHHGSKANTSPEFLKLIDCTSFAFSTDGSHHGHPDPQAIARILYNDPDRPKKLIFNFRQDSTTIWDDEELMKRWKYECVFPPQGTDGVTIDI